VRRAWGLVAAAHLAASLPSWPQPPRPAPEQAPHLSDSEAEALARKAMASPDGDFRRTALAQLQNHRFRMGKAPERQYCLFAQGMLEAQYATLPKGGATLRNLERIWPRSPYLDEASVVLGAEALEHKRFKEAEGRFRRTLAADLSPAVKRRAQELLLWLLVEQNRIQEGGAIIRALHPLGTESPTERGAAAIAICLCATDNRKEAEQAVKDYEFLFAAGPNLPRVRLAWGRMLGALGEARASAEELRGLLQTFPRTAEADEARLALATLLAEGKLPRRLAKEYPEPAELLKEIASDPATDLGRRHLLVRLQLAVRDGLWKDALDLVARIQSAKVPAEEGQTLVQLRGDAFRGWTRENLEKRQAGPLLPYLNPDLLADLGAGDRLKVGTLLAEKGLLGPAKLVADLAPEKERPALRRAILEAATPGSSPETTLALPPGSSPGEVLRRAQAEASLQHWGALAALLPRARPGAERIQVLLAYLRRPPAKGEAPRLREAEGWLGRCPEKGPEREPLAVLVADLRTGVGDWKGALALYPQAPRPEHLGWVTLMRATALARTGSREQARALLKTHEGEPAFRAERATLARQLGK
jgi:hypothetical protein